MRRKLSRFTRVALFGVYMAVIRVLTGHILGIAKFYPIRLVFYFLHRHLHPDVAQVGDHQMFLDSQDGLKLSINPTYEKLQTKAIKREIRKGDTVLDIGAHIGYYTLLLAKLVGENGRVFAFEPEPSNFGLLEKNVKANGYSNVVLVQKAVSNQTGIAKLFLNRSNTGGHSLRKGRYTKDSIEVAAIRLDDYFKDYDGKIDFIKMDIEGSEGEALRGMLSLLKKNNHLKIITEFSPTMIRASTVQPEEYLSLLVEHNFRLFSINERKGEIEPVTIDELMLRSANKHFITNLLCTRGGQ